MGGALGDELGTESCVEISDGSGSSVPMMSLFPRHVMGSHLGSFSHPGEGETQDDMASSKKFSTPCLQGAPA